MGSGEVFLCIILCYYVLCKLKMLGKACFEWIRHSSHAMFSSPHEKYRTWVVRLMSCGKLLGLGFRAT
jgi:hypothetical protein